MSDQQLKRNQLGVASIVFFVVAAAAPLLGMTGAAPMAIVLGTGAGVPGAYLLVGLTLVLFSVGYCAMSRRVTNSGAFFAYIGSGLGLPVGLGAALVSVLAYVSIQLAIYGFFGGLLALQWGLLPWWGWSGLAWGLVTVLSMRQVEVGARLLGVLLLLEMVCLLVTAVAILLHGGPEGLSWGAAFAPENVLVGGLSGSAGVSLAFALASFIGFEATAIYGEESIDPKTTVPRATYWAVALITVFFALTSFAIVTGLGASHVVDEVVKRSTVDGQALADPAAVLFSLAREFVGPGMASAMAILVISSLFAGLLAFQNSAARYLFALSRGGALPAALARVNRQGAPVHASAWVSVLTALVMAAFAVSDLDPIVQLFAWCSGVAVVAILMIEVLVSVGVWAYFRRSLEKVGAWSSTIAPLASAVLLSLGLYLLLSRFGLLTGLVMAGVDPAATAWGLSPLGWLLALLPAMVGVVGWAMAQLRPLGSNQLLKDILS